MLSVLSNLNKRFAVIQAVNLLFVVSIVVVTSVDSHTHVAHANHTHMIHDINAHNAEAVEDATKVFTPDTQTEEQDVNAQHGSFAESIHCFSFIVPPVTHVASPAPNVLKHDRLTQRLRTRYPSRLERPPKISV